MSPSQPKSRSQETLRLFPLYTTTGRLPCRRRRPSSSATSTASAGATREGYAFHARRTGHEPEPFAAGLARSAPPLWQWRMPVSLAPRARAGNSSSQALLRLLVSVRRYCLVYILYYIISTFLHALLGPSVASGVRHPPPNTYKVYVPSIRTGGAPPPAPSRLTLTIHTPKPGRGPRGSSKRR